MAVIDNDVSRAELTEHVDRYVGFERMVLFATIHVFLAVACLGLAFVGHIPVLAFLLFIGGSLATIIGIAVYGS